MSFDNTENTPEKIADRKSFWNNMFKKKEQNPMLNKEAKEILNNICRKEYGRDYLDSLDISEKILMEFGRQLCEKQKLQCIKESQIGRDLQGYYIVKDSIVNSKNVCDD